MAKKLTSKKARQILHDKEVHGQPLTDKQRRFFGAIASGAKPYKAESGGWLDKYIPKAQNGIEGTMGGLTDVGFNYNGAWGGTMQDGGKLKTVISNQTRHDWNAYVDWLDSQGMKGDPSLDKDSLGFKMVDKYRSVNPNTSVSREIITPLQEEFQNYRNWSLDQVRNKKATLAPGVTEENYMKNLSIIDGYPGQHTTSFKFPMKYLTMIEQGIPTSTVATLSTITDKKKMGGSIPGSVGFTYARTQGIPSEGPYGKKTMPSAQTGAMMRYYQEGLDFKPKTISQDGVRVDPMGYWNPENVGEPVIIPSNVITMEGVNQPLIGISDTGDMQYMKPGEDYEFEGESVLEIPVAKKGVSVNNADAQPIKKLDQLLNFTNYNKPTKGGWLDRYEN